MQTKLWGWRYRLLQSKNSISTNTWSAAARNAYKQYITTNSVHIRTFLALLLTCEECGQSRNHSTSNIPCDRVASRWVQLKIVGRLFQPSINRHLKHLQKCTNEICGKPITPKAEPRAAIDRSLGNNAATGVQLRGRDLWHGILNTAPRPQKLFDDRAVYWEVILSFLQG